MYGIPGVESLALRVTRAKAALRWATSKGTLGHEVSGLEKNTYVTTVQHWLLMHTYSFVYEFRPVGYLMLVLPLAVVFTSWSCLACYSN